MIFKCGMLKHILVIDSVRPKAITWPIFYQIIWRHMTSPGENVGISPVTDEFPSQRPVTRSFLCLNKRLSKQSRRWWFQTPSRSLWRHCFVFWLYHLFLVDLCDIFSHIRKDCYFSLGTSVWLLTKFWSISLNAPYCNNVTNNMTNVFFKWFIDCNWVRLFHSDHSILENWYPTAFGNIT